MGFEKVEDVVRPAVYDSDADIVVGVVGVGGLVDFGGAGGDDVGGVEVFVEGVCLAGVDHEEHFVIPESFRPVSQSVSLISKAPM